MGSGPQFIETDAPEGDASDRPIREQLLIDVQSARGRGDMQSVLRGLDMLAKIDGEYTAAAQDDRTAMPAAQVAESITEYLMPALRPLLAPGVTEAVLASAVRGALE